MSAADDDPRTNSVFVYLRTHGGQYERQKWCRPFVGKGLRDTRIIAAWELTDEQGRLTLGQLEDLFPPPGRKAG